MPTSTGGRKGSASGARSRSGTRGLFSSGRHPSPPRHASARLRRAALREALPRLRSQLADLEAAAVAAEHDAEQAEAAVEHARKRLAKRAADAKARRADAKALSDVDQDVRDPQPRPASTFTPTTWGSANAPLDPERERFYVENPDARR